MHLKIVQKAFLLILIPLLLELGFLFKLSTQLQSADRNMASQTKLGSALAYVDLVLFDVINAASGFFLFASFKDKHYLQAAANSASQLKAHRDTLQELAPQLTSDKPEVEAFIRRVDELANLLSTARDIYVENGYMSSVRAMGKLKSYMVRVHRAGNELLDKEVRQREELDQLRHWEYRRLQFMLAVFAALIVVAAVVLGFLLSINFNRRLKVLMINTQRIGANAALEPRLAGTDELAVLDGVVHKLSDDLAEARRRKEEVLAVVSHDLRTPLTSLGLTLELMETGALGSLNTEGQTAVTHGRSTVRSLVEMINDLLEVETVELGGLVLTLEKVPVDQLLSDSIATVSAAATKKGIEIKSNADRTAVVEMDRARMLRVLVNLLGNAIKFSPEGSTITLSANSLDSGYAVIRVSDQGPGIPPDKLATIFEKFQQAGRGDQGERAGVGLGLAICKGIIQAHGGTIGVESELGKGSTFWIKMPPSPNHPAP
ncbi:MAG TPA: HAMP domain-containing sensor histidine kinase [Candidatus Obscuribacterales bacterium]